MSDAEQLDQSRARSDFQRCIIELRNDGASWPTIARTMCSTVRIVRASWGRANYEQRGGYDQSMAEAVRENPTMGNEQHARGVPIMARGVGGASPGTRPGDRLQPEAPPARRRKAS
jgi:hypothetical protein